MNKTLTADSITGAIFGHITTKVGEHWMDAQRVIQITCKQDAESNSANVYVLSRDAARDLYNQLNEEFAEWQDQYHPSTAYEL